MRAEQERARADCLRKSVKNKVQKTNIAKPFEWKFTRDDLQSLLEGRRGDERLRWAASPHAPTVHRPTAGALGPSPCTALAGAPASPASRPRQLFWGPKCWQRHLRLLCVSKD